MKEWHSPTAAWRFAPSLIDWMCEHYELLIEGRWPDKKTGYIDSIFGGPSPFRPGAYFENTMYIMAEFHWRIDECGDDGSLFRAVRCEKWDVDLLRTLIRRDEDWIDKRCNRVFNYISGKRRKRTYQEACRH